jgi:hypothetical protein
MDLALGLMILLSLPCWQKAATIGDIGLRRHSDRILGMLVGLIVFVFLFFRLVDDTSIPVLFSFVIVVMYMLMETRGITSFAGTLVDDKNSDAVSERTAQLGGSAFILCMLIQSDRVLQNYKVMPIAYIALGFLILAAVPSRAGKRLRRNSVHEGLQKSSLSVSAGLLVTTVSLAVSIYLKQNH